MRQRKRLVSAYAPAILMVGFVATGCSTTGASKLREMPAGTEAEPAIAGQFLYRAEIGIESERATVRLALRLVSEDEFDLGFADVLGQALGRLAVHGEKALWLDLEGRTFCRFDSNAPLQLAGLRVPLPARDLPALLRRDHPSAGSFAEPLAQAGRIDRNDRLDRRWSGERVLGRWQAWTLWEDGAPSLWFRAGRREEGESATLSGRSPAFHLQWRETGRGALPPTFAVDVDGTDGFAVERCTDAPPA